jgi:glycosyltransferase involved in cell wall biosynthesis
MNNHFTIAINCCQQEKWIAKCIESCVNQNYDNFDVILVDALSTDNTYNIAKSYEDKFENLKVYQNHIRVPQIANVLFLTKMAKDNSIMVSVDGDDWLKNNNVLNKLNNIYNNREVWVTYGSYENMSNGSRAGWVYKYPDTVINNNLFRDHNWLATHLRTYKKELFMKIDEEDFKRDGNWMSTTGDQAFMIPMLEMAGYRSEFIPDVLYVYNDIDTSNDSHTNNRNQVEMAAFIARKEKYTFINNL